jgi:hypothetical protein
MTASSDREAMMLRREVELPARLHQRVSFYLGLGSLLLSLSIILDAALWVRATVAVESSATVRHLRLRAPCAERRSPTSQPTSPPAQPAHPGQFHAELMQQLKHIWAAVDDLDAGGRYGHVSAADPDILAQQTREAKAELQRLRKFQVARPH